MTPKPAADDYGDRKCHGCGAEHGSITAERNCMRRALRVARADLDEARIALSVMNGRRAR